MAHWVIPRIRRSGDMWLAYWWHPFGLRVGLGATAKEAYDNLMEDV